MSTADRSPGRLAAGSVAKPRLSQVLFHVATAMPCSPKDPSCNEKRKYIGNDFVSIVYNDSGADFNIHTIKVSEEAGGAPRGGSVSNAGRARCRAS